MQRERAQAFLVDLNKDPHALQALQITFELLSALDYLHFVNIRTIKKQALKKTSKYTDVARISDLFAKPALIVEVQLKL